MPALTACKRALCPEASEPSSAQIKPGTGGPQTGALGARAPSTRGGTPAGAASRSTMSGVGVSSGRARAESGPVKKAAKRTAPPPPSSTTPVPCPRCGSEATKFCYYNNYDPQQPRYYCKDCQRYWTVGGVLRNVPPGSGRRKSRSAASREHRKASASNLASSTLETAPTSEVAPSGPALPVDLMQSNPLASMLISNLGLGSSSAPMSAQPARVPGDTLSTGLSNQTAATTQCLPLASSLLGGGAGAAPMLVTPALLARLQAGPDGQGNPTQPQQPAASGEAKQGSAGAPSAHLSSIPSASAFTQHTRSSEGPTRSTESQAAAHPAQAASTEQHARSLEAQQSGKMRPGSPSGTAGNAVAALPPANLQMPNAALDASVLPFLSGAPLMAPGKGAPQLPPGLYPAPHQSQQALQVQSQLLANMAVLPASAQVLLAQNAAWLAVQASTHGVTGMPDFAAQQASFTPPPSFGTSFASSASIAPNGQGVRSGSSGSQGSGVNASKSVANGGASSGPPAPSSAFVPPILPLCTAAPSAPSAPAPLQWPLQHGSTFLPKPCATPAPAPALWTSWLPPAQNATATVGPRPTFSSLPTPQDPAPDASVGMVAAHGGDAAGSGRA